MAQEQVEIEFRNEMQQLMMMQQNPQMQQQMQNDIQNKAAEIIGDLTEQYAQTVSPASSEDPLVTIRKQELALRGQDIERKAKEFEEKQEFDKEKERNQRLVDQQRIDISEEALNDKTRIAEERIEAQRDIASANINRRNQSG